MKESVVSLKEKNQNNNDFPTFKLPTSTKIFYNWPELNIIFDD